MSVSPRRDGAGAGTRTRNDGFEGRSDRPFHHTCMALHAGTDPAPLRSTGACSAIELMQHGAPGGPRTHSQLLKRQPLFQLSYRHNGGPGGI